MARARRTTEGPARADIRDVARLAQVSIATVSRTVNGVPTVDPKLAAKVRAAIEELGFTPHGPARALVSGRSRMLGLIVSEITNPFFPELIQGFEDAAVAQGYEILIGSTGYEPNRMESCVNRMLEREVDGVAVMTFGIEAPLLERLAARRVPLVFVDMAPEGALASALEVDYGAGIREAVGHLAALGHREIAWISGALHLRSAALRQEAWTAAMEAMGLPARLTFEGSHTLESGIAAAHSFLAGARPPTAIMCSNDMTAIGVMHALHGKGLCAPEDMSVVGFDDIRFAQYTLPPLTSVRMGSRELARCAVRALQDHIGDTPHKQPSSPYRVDTRLIVRKTTGAPRAGLLKPSAAAEVHCGSGSAAVLG